MAKKSSIEKNNRRKRMSKNAAPQRAKLKAIIADKTKPMEERFAATLKLAEMPRNSSPTRIRNRCELTGRPRSVYRKNKLSRIALPRVRDFRGLNPKSFDGRGNYSLGIKEHIIFPEIDFDKVSEARGMDITVCTTAKSDDEARALLTAFNFPFRQ